MTATVAPTRTQTRRPTFPERYGWVLVAALCTLMTVFGVSAFFLTPDPAEPITGSLCCTGEQLSTVDPWAYDYAQELARYYCAGTGRDINDFCWFSILAKFKSGCLLEYKVAQAEAGHLSKETGRFFARIVEQCFRETAAQIARLK